MGISKTAERRENCRRRLYSYDSARAAFRDVLSELQRQREHILLLPGYIGYSPNEGSGVYDPVIETGIEHVFYRMDRRLQIDLSDLEGKLSRASKPAIVLLIHYFGYPDESIGEVVRLCRKYNAVVIEDAAHALYSDLIDHSCGSYGDYTLYSIHKMLPFERGGVLKTSVEGAYPGRSEDWCASMFDYDFYEIAKRRKQNGKKWFDLLRERSDRVEILRPYREDVTPQTFPIVLHGFDRNELYFALNGAGFGAVSLYHTMIQPILDAQMEDALYLSRHIINMPVHQDIEEGQIEAMCDKLLEVISR